MDAIRTNFCRLLADPRGATAVEYGLIASLIVLAIIGSLAALGGGAGGMWAEVSAMVAAAL